MLTEPSGKRAVAFVDGQNLYHAARQAFGYTYPNYDVHALVSAICQSHTWTLAETREDVPVATRSPSGYT
jgi:hypothetical protein